MAVDGVVCGDGDAFAGYTAGGDCCFRHLRHARRQLDVEDVDN